jgi:hypothetical protein
LTPVLECGSVADCRYQCCRRYRPDTLDLAEALADFALAVDFADLLVITRDPRLQIGRFRIQFGQE